MNDLGQVALYFSLLIYLVILVAVLTDRVVGYIDGLDLSIHLGLWVIPAITFVALGAGQHPPQSEPQSMHLQSMPLGTQIIAAGGGLFTLGLLLASIRNGFRANNPWIAPVMILFKIASAAIGLLAIFHEFGRLTNKKSRAGDRAMALLLIGLIGWVGKRLVNGSRVAQRQGMAVQNQAPRARAVP